MTDYKDFVPNVHFELIPIKNLVSNQEYQRNLSDLHVKRAAEHFDLYQINPVKVSRRDGVNYVFNGQHTIEIIALVSGSRETPVWCMVYDDLVYEHEADIFANQQKFVKPLTAYDTFIANVEAGNPEYLTIKSIIESYNLKITAKRTNGSLCAISTAEYIYRKYGYHVLDNTIALCIATWQGDPNSLVSNILKGVAKLLVAYGERLDMNMFKEKIGMYSLREIIRNANARNNGSLGYAESMLAVYNKRMKYPLPISKLYNKRSVSMPDFAVESEDEFIEEYSPVIAEENFAEIEG